MSPPRSRPATWSPSLALLVLCLALGGCRGTPPAVLELRLVPGAQEDLEGLVFAPASRVRALPGPAGLRRFAVTASLGRLRIDGPGLCPLELLSESLPPGVLTRRVLRPLLEVDADQPLAEGWTGLQVKLGCPSALGPATSLQAFVREPEAGGLRPLRVQRMQSGAPSRVRNSASGRAPGVVATVGEAQGAGREASVEKQATWQAGTRAPQPRAFWVELAAPISVRSSLSAGEAPLGARPPADSGGQSGSIKIVARSRGSDPPTLLQLRLRAGTLRWEQSLRLSALPRASGHPQLSTGTALQLRPAGLQLRRAPHGAPPRLLRLGVPSAVRQARAASKAGDKAPDATLRLVVSQPGRYLLQSAEGASLLVSAHRYDQARLDCGEAGCHPHEAAAFQNSPMATVGRRGLEGTLGSEFDPRCALACHASGEPGLADGGAAQLARELRLTIPVRGRPGTWASLPRDLRRVAGVGCNSCHGPGSLPTHGQHWTLLRAQLCAVCHDAPPRYNLVARWRASPMARADADPATRVAPCARCHSTAGYLELIGQVMRPVASPGEAEPGPLGVACAACHAVHRAGSYGHSLRRPPPELEGEPPPGASALCMGCHSAGRALTEGGQIFSAAKQLVEANLGDLQGSPFVAALPAGPHAKVPGGCLGCHDPHAGGQRQKACRPCHPKGRGLPPQRLAAEARRLLDAGPHATGLQIQRPNTPQALGRTLLSLVAADPAAELHGGAFARALLDQGSQLLQGEPKPGALQTPSRVQSRQDSLSSDQDP